MTTQLLDLVPGDPITLGTSSNTYALTMKNLGAVAQQSAKIDFGANYAQEWFADLLTKFGAAPTANLTMDIYIGYSGSGTAGTDNWAGCGGGDAAFSGYSGGSVAQSVQQLCRIGSLSLDHNVGPQSGYVGAFTPKNRYGYIVWVNNSGQTTTNVDADHKLSLRPVNMRAEAIV
jgi:hypothetical protein